MKINFFGASVTQQKDGFAKKFADVYKDIECNIFGYGSRHIKDAGVCYVDLALNNRPNLLIIDWYSTSYISKDNLDEIALCTDVIIRKSVIQNTIPIFLFLPQIGDVSESHDWLKHYLKGFNIPFVDIGEKIPQSDICLKDTIHTSDAGSVIYAKVLVDFLHIFLNENPRKISIPPINKYFYISSCEVNLVLRNFLILKGDAEVVGISQYVGPYSGYVSIDGFLLNNWDRWCYYEREMINFVFKVSGTSKINIFQDDFDRSLCKQAVDWPKIKQLKLLKIFYIGDVLTVDDGS